MKNILNKTQRAYTLTIQLFPNSSIFNLGKKVLFAGVYGCLEKILMSKNVGEMENFALSYESNIFTPNLYGVKMLLPILSI